MLRAVEIFKLIKEGSFTPYLQENLNNIDEAIKELEEYEQNFKQKEFDYRTKCQNTLSLERLAIDEKDSCDNCKFKDIHECVECLTCRRFWGDNFELKRN